VYSLISSSLIISLILSPFKNSKEIFFSNFNLILASLIFLNFLSIAGIPPLLGFIVKLITISSIIILNFDYLVITILIFSSLISLFYYLRLIFSSIILSIKINKLLTFKLFKTPFNLLLLATSSFSLLIFPSFFIFF